MLTVIIIDPFTAFVNILQKTFLSFAKKRMRYKEFLYFLCILRMTKKDLIFQAECDIIF